MASRKATVQSIVESFNERDIDKMTAPVSDNFVYQLLPKSLERGPMDVAGFRGLFEATKSYFNNFKFEVVDTFEDSAADKMIVWANVTSDTHVGKFATEVMLIFYFDKAGKIYRWIEWIDSAVGKEFEQKLQGQ
ncbi:Atr11 [Stachybotrys chartarum IBT 40288]|nr:Atr11 [Stachybotrys chartarum IBT 40288]